MRASLKGNLTKLLVTCALTLAVSYAHAQADEETSPDLPLTGKTETLSYTVNEGSWVSLDVDPGGESIVMDLLGDLYELPIGGGDATPITSGLAFDAQPQISPDGQWIAFISDKDGADNLWVVRRNGSDARQLSEEKQFGLISPSWMPDSKRIVVTKTATQPEFTLYHIDGGAGVTLSGKSAEDKFWGVGASVSPDGRHLYFSQKVDSNGPVQDFPAAQVSRYDFVTGHVDQLTRAEGGGLRPTLSHDGTLLAYATRRNAETGIRIRNLETGEDRWLTYPVQRDAQENFRPPSRDVLPGFAFTPDDRHIVINTDGGLHRVAVADGERQAIEFTATVTLDVGPDLTSPYRVPEGPLTATLIHDPQPAPGGTAIVTSVLGKLYLTDTDGSTPQRLTDEADWEFKPVYSPDGRWIAYVTWSMSEGGHIYRMRASGRGNPQRLSDHPAFYTDLAYAPDGDTLFALRGNEYMRNQTFSEFTGLGIPLDLVALPATGGEVRTILPARSARNPHFGADAQRIFLYDEEGLFSVRVDGSDRRGELKITGPKGNRRSEKPLPAEMVTMSPNGDYALALVNKQVWVVAAAQTGAVVPAIAVEKPSLPAARITDVGADFFGWSDDGAEIHWAIGNTWHRRALDSIEFRAEEDDEDEGAEEAPFVAADDHPAVSKLKVQVTVPRDQAAGASASARRRYHRDGGDIDRKDDGSTSQPRSPDRRQSNRRRLPQPVS